MCKEKRNRNGCLDCRCEEQSLVHCCNRDEKNAEQKTFLMGLKK
jgi:hypothetical protein